MTFRSRAGIVPGAFRQRSELLETEDGCAHGADEPGGRRVLTSVVIRTRKVREAGRCRLRQRNGQVTSSS
jgi:hypothetical protein